MFSFFKKKKEKNSVPEILDLNGEIIGEGDTVICHRYELGECTVTLEGRQFFYIPKNGGDKVSYVKMIDAITGNQKVTKNEASDQ